MRVQWDPERDLELKPLDHKAIQIGLSNEAVDHYIDDWIISISDNTKLLNEVGELVKQRDFETARRLVPIERPYPLSSEIKAITRATMEARA